MLDKTNLIEFAINLAKESQRLSNEADPAAPANYTARMAASYTCGALVAAISSTIREATSDAK